MRQTLAHRKTDKKDEEESFLLVVVLCNYNVAVKTRKKKIRSG